MTDSLEARAHLLRAAVGFCLVPADEPEPKAPAPLAAAGGGVGDVVTGMKQARLLAASRQHRRCDVGAVVRAEGKS
jgi:hypothetical protein